ncbi:MAG: TonB family protein, partial [Pseudomonadota bacterium]
VIHLMVLLILFGKPPDMSKKVYFSPVYSVSLVDAPPGPPGPKSEQATNKVSLWKGPTLLQSEIKSSVTRSHSIITVAKKEEAETSSDEKKQAAAKEGPQKPQTTSGSEEQKTDSAAENTPPATGGGGGGGTTNLRFSLYYRTIWNKIQQAWVLPPYDKKSGHLETIVVITISREGKILGMEFEKKSGDENLDNSVIRAIKKADPLPPFPPDLKESVMEIGIRFIPDEKNP